MTLKQLILFSFCSLICLASHAEDSFIFEDDDLIFATELTEDTPFFDTQDAASMITRQGAQDIINLLLQIDALDILDQDLYLLTNNFNSRSLLDLPIFELQPCCGIGGGIIPCGGEVCRPWIHRYLTTDLFFNKTDRSNFTRKSTDLSSYLALNQPTLIGRLQNTIEQLHDLFQNDQFDIARIFSLFCNLTVEERRAGFMATLFYNWPQCEVRFLMPIYYLERNYILRPNEIRAVEAEFGAADPEEQERFQKQHLISDRFGIGDARLEFSHTVFAVPNYEVRVGLFTTVPTAKTFRGGMFGSIFPQQASLPLLDIQRLFDLAQNPTPEAQAQALAEISAYVLGALDRLSANLLDAPLGNGGHVTIGGLLRTNSCLAYFIPRAWAEQFRLHSRMSLEYLFPHWEMRSYIARNSFAQFEQRNFTDPRMADENLLFIEQELAKKFYLLSIDTRIQPGPIFRWTSYGCYSHNRWQLTGGTDTWLQFQEIAHRLNTFDLIKQYLDRPAARRPFAYQYKMFGGVQYHIDRPSYELNAGLVLDYTIWTTGIGADYTVGIRVQTSF